METDDNDNVQDSTEDEESIVVGNEYKLMQLSLQALHRSLGVVWPKITATHHQLYELQVAKDVQEEKWPQMEEMLQKFATVFETPKGLPSSRFQDHKIVLKDGAQPVNWRPYR